VSLDSLSASPIQADVHLRVTDPYGKSTVYDKQIKTRRSHAAGGPLRAGGPAPFGLYTVETTVTSGDFKQARTGTFLRLPPSTRKSEGHREPVGRLVLGRRAWDHQFDRGQRALAEGDRRP